MKMSLVLVDGQVTYEAEFEVDKEDLVDPKWMMMGHLEPALAHLVGRWEKNAISK